MPIYEYQCNACGQVIEKWQKFSDPLLTTCPNCGGSLTKLISQSSFHLKGSGWYVTDYHQTHSGSSKANDTDENKKTDKSTEAPPAEAPAAKSDE